MSGITEWGEVISSNLEFETYEDKARTADKLTFGEMRLIEGQIVKVVTKEDKNNPNQLFTLYDVDPLYPDGSSVGVLKGVRAVQPFFGGTFNNFFEIIPPSPGQKADDASVNRSLKPGTQVLVGFVGGQKSSPVILGALPHTSKIAVKNRPTTDKGPGYLEGEFQGVNYSVDKDGAFKLKWTGPKTEEGKLVNEKLGPTEFSITKAGSVELKTNQQQSIKVDREAKTITVTSGKSSITMAQEGEKLTIVCTDVNVKASGKAMVEVGGDTTIKSKGKVNVSSDSAIQLQKGGSADQSYVLGEKLTSFLEELMAQQLAIANAIGNLGVPTPPILQGPAIQAMTSKLPSLLSKHIKGT